MLFVAARDASNPNHFSSISAVCVTNFFNQYLCTTTGRIMMLHVADDILRKLRTQLNNAQGPWKYLEREVDHMSVKLSPLNIVQLLEVYT